MSSQSATQPGEVSKDATRRSKHGSWDRHGVSERGSGWVSPRDSATRVACFLIVVPAVAEGADQMTAGLKIESRSVTDVALTLRE